MVLCLVITTLTPEVFLQEMLHETQTELHQDIDQSSLHWSEQFGATSV